MSFNFNPQPRPEPLPFSAASMHLPVLPRINSPVLGSFDYVKQNYWEGAVRIQAGDDLTGQAVSGNFSNFVCSFWATNLFTGTAPDFNNYAAFFGTEGSYDLNINLGPTGGVPFTISNFLIRLVESNGAIGLYFLNSNSTGLIGAWHGPPDTLGETLNNDEILPTGIWHHYIVSFEGATNRCQVACDRGGGPNWGGGVMDTAIGNFGFAPTVFHPGTAPQGIWGGSTAGIPTSFTNPGSGVFSDRFWRIQAPNSSSIDLAYFYFGVSARFFDLTFPGNLDYFVTPSLTPVNLGPAGSYVAPVGINPNPLTCLIMHTGKSLNVWGLDDINPWRPDVVYGFTALASYNGKNYFSFFLGLNINNRPDISPDKWDIYTPLPGYQFPYNAANGVRWGGVLSDAPTAPPTGV